jgi:ribonuclease BN (tRNA processing enzyme)
MQSKNTRFHLLYSIVFGLIAALAAGFSYAHDGKNNDRHHDNLKAVDYVKGDLSVMVLGSGGPAVTADGRASAGYLVFTDGQPRVLMDVGGGTHKNFVTSGANIKDLDIVLLSHLHIDHMGDLSPVVKAMYFQNRAFNLANGTVDDGDERTAPVRIFGPGENAAVFPDTTIKQYPSAQYFVDSHYAPEIGNERYLHIFTKAISAGTFGYEATNVAPDWMTYAPVTLLNEKGLKITAVGVNHGPVPALAFRIDYKGKSIVYSGDTSSKGGNMIDISKNADLLIYDTAIMNDAPDGPNDAVFFALHTTPNRIGEVATAANAKKLVLSHITAITQSRIDEVKGLIRAQGYNGEISEASDLKVYNVDRHHHH